MLLWWACLVSFLAHAIVIVASPGPTRVSPILPTLQVQISAPMPEHKPLPQAQPAPQPAPPQPTRAQPDRIKAPEKPPKKKSGTNKPQAPRKASTPARSEKSALPLPDARTRAQIARQLAQEMPYPLAAIAQGQQGDVRLLILTDEQGRIISATIIEGSGFPLLDEAARKAARRLAPLPQLKRRSFTLRVPFRLR
jgi:protein TonB